MIPTAMRCPRCWIAERELAARTGSVTVGGDNPKAIRLNRDLRTRDHPRYLEIGVKQWQICRRVPNRAARHPPATASPLAARPATSTTAPRTPPARPLRQAARFRGGIGGGEASCGPQLSHAPPSDKSDRQRE